MQALSSTSSLAPPEEASLEMIIQFGTHSINVQRHLLEKDFSNFEDLFDGPPPFRLPDLYQNGWQWLFLCLDPEVEEAPVLENFDEFAELVHCTIISGSKKALKLLQRSLSLPQPQEGSDPWQFYHELCYKYPPNVSSEADELIAQLSRAFECLKLPESGQSNTPSTDAQSLLAIRGKSYRSLRICSIDTQLAAGFSHYFPNITTLVLKEAHSWKTIQQLITEGKKLHVLKLRIFDMQLIPLAAFEVCSDLTNLQLRGVTTPQEHKQVPSGISPFANTSALAKLKTLVIKRANISRDTVSSIAMIPLEMLDFRGSCLETPGEILKLSSCQQLRVLDLTDLQQANHLESNIRSLAKKMPHAIILPEIARHEYYNEVLTMKHHQLSAYIFQPDEVELVNMKLLKKLLDETPKRPRRSTHTASSSNNKPFPFSADTISAPDDRKRIASQEPFDHVNQGDFWQAVLDHNVSVIAMVKGVDEFRYFPELGETRPYVGKANEKISVTCISIETLGYGIIKRQFTVGSKTISHLQIDWKDMCGIDVELLQQFFFHFQKSEAENPGASIVHCKAGLGRTGTFFACLIVSLLMKAAPKTELWLNLEKLLLDLRDQRESMILTEDQLFTVLQFFALLHSQRC